MLISSIPFSNGYAKTIINKLKLVFIIWSLCSLTPTILASNSASTPAPNLKASLEIDASTDTTANEIPVEQLQNFANVVNTIKTYYVKPVNDKELFNNAIKGMLSGLDPHSDFLNKNDFEELKTSTSGKFGGLGIEVTMDDNFIKVIAPIDDTPAAKAGIKAGDLIVRIDKTPVKGITLKEAVELMRGKPGTDVKLLVIREKASSPLDIKITRDIIKIQSVKNEVIQDHFGYIRIAQFQSDTEDNVKKAYANIKDKIKDHQVRGLVIDLRNNPGGILNGAIDVSEMFLDYKKLKYNGLIVSTKGRGPEAISNAYAKESDITNGVPMVILVNKGSASASEIVAGALQDHKRAIIMGTQTFGKGSVQTVLPLQGDVGLKLTTALYYTPSGTSIQAKGITPDITVDDLSVKIADNNIAKFIETSEADLRDHLANGNSSSSNNSDEVAAPKDNTDNKDSKDNLQDSKNSKTKNKTLVEKDYQLNEAINLLKGMGIVANKN